LGAPTKEGLVNKTCEMCFNVPLTPQDKTLTKLSSKDFKIRYKAYRSIASQYIHKKQVRDFYLNKSTVCKFCGATENLHIDHIISVYTCAQEIIDCKCMNCEKNLRVLCGSCNMALTPNINSTEGLKSCRYRRK